MDTLKNIDKKNSKCDYENDIESDVWNLSDLYYSITDPQIELDLDKSIKWSKSFKENFEGKLLESSLNSDFLLDSVKFYEKINEKLGKILSYAYLKRSENLNDERVGIFYQKICEKISDINQLFVFFALEINKIDEILLEKLMNSNDNLKKYEPFFRKIKLFKSHQLNEQLESLFLDKSTTSNQAIIRLYDEEISRVICVFDNEELSVEEATHKMSDKDPLIREKAAKALSKGLSEKINIFSFCFNVLLKDKQIEDNWRKYQSSDTERHLNNEIDPEIVDLFTSVIKDNYPSLSHRYYKAKAKLLSGVTGKKKLDYWDRNAPYILQYKNPQYKSKYQDQNKNQERDQEKDQNLQEQCEDKKKISFENAKEIVLDSYGSFSKKLQSIANEFFEKKWIDIYPRKGKQSGAFSHPTVPSSHPYILLNYQGDIRDVMTLAHEVGHGCHQVLSSKQGYLLFDTPLTIAETASVFGEMLTFQNLLSKAKNKQETIAILVQKIDDMLNTVVRQVAFYEFEKLIHERRKDGELSLSDFGDIWIATQKEALGEYVELDDITRVYWSYISHFIHAPFYVYAYAFGDCVVNSLYRVYQKELDKKELDKNVNYDSNFEEKYIAMLEAGGSETYMKLLSNFGLDPRNRKFWQDGVDFISNTIDDFCKLVED